MIRGFERRFKPLEILTEEQIEAIQRGTLGVLQRTGIRFESERALNLFEKNGCQVDRSNNRVKFPPGLVEECLRKCPSSFYVKARDSKNDLIIGGNTLYFIAAVGMETVELDTWETRVPTKNEDYDSVKVLDALDTIHFLGPYCPYFGFKGVPSVMAIPESCAAKIRNSVKCQWTGSQNESEIFNIEMAKAVGMNIIGNINSSAPLTFYSDAVEAIFRYIGAGFPITLGSGTIYGGTGPATIAGSSITDHAQIMAGIVLAQLIKPGAKILADDFSFPQNMGSGSPGFGQIGCSLHQAAFHQIWRKYGIPTMNGGSGPAFSSSKKIDFQCGYEKSIGALISALSGANAITFHGSIYGELTWHPVQAILDDDIAGMIGRFIEGIEVNDETLAIDLINEVGPIPGHYLNKAHTRKWWKKEQFVPKVADRLTYPEWMKTDKKSCIDYAKERMDGILATHKIDPPLTESQEKEIERILKEAREYYKKKGLITDAEWKAYIQDLESSNYPYA